MAILKLKNGRQNSVVAEVASVAHVPTKNPLYKDQYRFGLVSGDDLYVDQAAAERQAKRLSLNSVNDFIGQTVTFWKRAMDGEGEDGRGYLNIELGGTPRAGGGAPPTDDYVGRDLRAKGVPVSATSWEDIKDRYIESLSSAAQIALDVKETIGIDVDPQQVAATLFIERNRKGV